MGESRWEKEQRWLNEDHAARRAESTRAARLLKGQAKIDATNARMAAAGRADEPTNSEFRRLGVEWYMKKPKVMERIAAHPELPDDTRTAWCGMLERTLYADKDTSELIALREAIRNTATRHDWGLVLLANAVDELITLTTEGRRHLWA